MKYILYIITVAFVLFTSCSSDNDTILNDSNSNNGSTKKQEVSLNITTRSSQEIKSLTEGNIDLKKIIFAVFQIKDNHTEDTSNLVLLDSIKMNSNDTIPEIKFDLGKGNYVVKVFASSRNDFLYFGLSEGATLKDALIMVNNTASQNEFLGSLNLKVEDSPIKANVDLNRVVGKVEIVITDLNKLPDSVLSISAHIESKNIIGEKIWITPFSLGLTNENYARYVNGDINVIPLVKAQFPTHSENNPIVFYTLQSGNSGVLGTPGIYSGGSLFLYLNDGVSDNTILNNDSRKILVAESLNVLPNKIIRFVGRVMGNGYGFSISVNHDWDSDSEIIEVNNKV